MTWLEGAPWFDGDAVRSNEVRVVWIGFDRGGDGVG